MAQPVAPVLREFIQSFHVGGGVLPMKLERVLPGGQVAALVNLFEDEFRVYHGAQCERVQRRRGAILAGASSQARVIDTREQRCLVTVNFRTGGAWPFFRVPLAEAQDGLVELGDLWGRDGALLRERLLEAATAEAKFAIFESVLLGNLTGAEERNTAMRFAAAALGRGVAVRQVTAELGLLPKTFVRRFVRQMGMTPKRYSRVMRLQRVLRAVRDRAAFDACGVDWSEVAADHRYTDQAHFIHDFRELTGLTPTAYAPRSAAEHNHVPVVAGA